jgi:hypothetical protein
MAADSENVHQEEETASNTMRSPVGVAYSEIIPRQAPIMGICRKKRCNRP